MTWVSMVALRWVWLWLLRPAAALAWLLGGRRRPWSAHRRRWDDRFSRMSGADRLDARLR